MARALILFLALAFMAAVSAVVGVYLLAGTGWALVSVSVVFAGAAEAVRRGMSANG